VRPSDGAVRVLDLGDFGQSIVFTASNVPWVYSNPPAGSCTSNFCVNPGNLTLEASAYAAHGMYSICPESATSVEGGPRASWGSVKVLHR
jgi:hypothetical protein